MAANGALRPSEPKRSSETLLTLLPFTSIGAVCKYLRLALIDFFPLISEQVKDGVCTAAGTIRAPQGFGNPFVPNKPAIQAARNTQSVLFAIINAAAHNSKLELALSCTNMKGYVETLNSEHLNGTLIASTLCKFTKVIPVPVAKEMIRSWMTRYYITVLQNVSNSSKWEQWLCDNVDTEMMDAVGLNGDGVMQQVCGTNTTFPAFMRVTAQEFMPEY
jgi:hypothetical protein